MIRDASINQPGIWHYFLNQLQYIYYVKMDNSDHFSSKLINLKKKSFTVFT